MSFDVVGASPQHGRRSGRLRSVLVPLVLLLAAGVLLAVVWRLLDPYTARLGDDEETAAAVDGTLVLLGIVAGFLTAAFVLFLPGAFPVARSLTAIVGAALGAVICWQVGNRIGTPNLRAVAATFTWPMTTAVCLFLGALLPGTSTRLQRHDQQRISSDGQSWPYGPT